MTGSPVRDSLESHTPTGARPSGDAGSGVRNNGRGTDSEPALAVAYLRVSGRGQVDGHGFERQRDTIREYADEHGIEIVDEFRDEGVSGKTMLSERPGLSRLFDRLIGNGVRLVLIERVDRLARDLVVGELMLQELRRAEIRVVAAEDGTDLSGGMDDESPTGKLVRRILGTIAEFERDLIVGKLRAARERKRRDTGRCEGPRPFGELGGEQGALRRLLELARKPRGRPRRSAGEIARLLNAEGVPTRSGRPWSRSTVAGVLARHGKR